VDRNGKILNPKSLTPKERACVTKLLYNSRTEAKRAAKQHRGHGDDNRPYKCPYCSG